MVVNMTKRWCYFRPQFPSVRCKVLLSSQVNIITTNNQWFYYYHDYYYYYHFTTMVTIAREPQVCVSLEERAGREHHPMFPVSIAISGIIIPLQESPSSQTIYLYTHTYYIYISIFLWRIFHFRGRRGVSDRPIDRLVEVKTSIVYANSFTL